MIWRWAAAAVLAALLAACAAPQSQRAAAPAAPAQAPSNTESPQTPTPASATALRIETTQAAADAQATVDLLRIAPTPSALSPAPSSAAPAAVAPVATLAPSLTPEPLPTASPIPPTSEAPVGSAAPTEAMPSATANPTSIPTVLAAESTEMASSAILLPSATVTLATETPVQAEAAVSAAKEPTPTTEAFAATVTQLISIETRIVELEWPPEIRLGDTDIVRVALVPFETGYIVKQEFPGNTTFTTTVPVSRPDNYDVFAVGRLDGARFAISPEAETAKALLPGQTVDWRWSIAPSAAGQHRLALVIKLRWVPVNDLAGKTREADLFTKGLTVQVPSVMGMSTAQASSTGLVGLLIGSGLGLFGLAFRRAPQIKTTLAQVINPNANLKIETHATMQLADDETALLRTLFARYDRIVIENEFRSGYSGARTFLVHPIHADGRADAFTIAKMGVRASIQREFDNYQRFVKDTLPPITARIQEPPVTAPALFNRDDKAVLRYTFIGEQGRMPVSLREALLGESANNVNKVGAGLINKLFETFGPNWWMQRKPFVFRLAQEYDRMLPAHFVIEPVAANAVSGAKLMDGRKPAEQDAYRIGDMVVLQHFPATGIEVRADGRSLSLRGEAVAGQAPLRVRWASLETTAQPRKFANGVFGRVVGTRETLLRELTAGADLQGLADPIGKLPHLLNERVQGTQSTIHGDLNLENGLVGPGGFVWLIDFAETRDGHALVDFAHLEAEIIAHVIAPTEPDSAEFVAQLRAGGYTLLETVHQIAAKCLFNPLQMREYWLALGVTCLGATKYGNLSAHQQHLLFLTAAYLFEML